MFGALMLPNRLNMETSSCLRTTKIRNHDEPTSFLEIKYSIEFLHFILRFLGLESYLLARPTRGLLQVIQNPGPTKA